MTYKIPVHRCYCRHIKLGFLRTCFTRHSIFFFKSLLVILQLKIKIMKSSPPAPLSSCIYPMLKIRQKDEVSWTLSKQPIHYDFHQSVTFSASLVYFFLKLYTSITFRRCIPVLAIHFIRNTKPTHWLQFP